MQEPSHLQLNVPKVQLLIPLPVAAAVSRVFERQIKFNQATGSNKYYFGISENELPEPMEPASSQAFVGYLRYLFDLGGLPQVYDPIALNNVFSVIIRLDYHNEAKLKELIELHLDKAALGELLPVELIIVAFRLSPGRVTSYLHNLSNALYRDDAFTPQVIRYFFTLIQHNQQLALALQPDGYPLVYPERIERYAANLFLLNPLHLPTDPEDPKLLEDYTASTPVTAIPTITYDFDINKQPLPIPDPPPSRALVASREVVITRLLEVFPELLAINDRANSYISDLRLQAAKLGYVISGDLSAILDDWAFKRYKRDISITITIYGESHEQRVAFMRYLRGELGRIMGIGIEPGRERGEAIYKGEFVFFRGASVTRLFFAVRLALSKAATPIALLASFPLSSMQIGYDLHQGLVCTPAFALYYPLRVSLLMQAKVQTHFLVRAAFRGFTIQSISLSGLLNATYITDEGAIEMALGAADTYLPTEYISKPILRASEPLFLYHQSQDLGPLNDVDWPHATSPGYPGAEYNYFLRPYLDPIEVGYWKPLELIEEVAETREQGIEFLESPSTRIYRVAVTNHQLVDVQRYPLSHYRKSLEDVANYGHLQNLQLDSFTQVGSRFLMRNCQLNLRQNYAFPMGQAPRNIQTRETWHVGEAMPSIPPIMIPQLPDVAYPVGELAVIQNPYMQGERRVTQIPYPGPLEHPELLVPGETEYPVHLSGIIELRPPLHELEQNNINNELPNLYEPLVVEQAEPIITINIATRQDFEQLSQLLYSADALYQAEAHAINILSTIYGWMAGRIPGTPEERTQRFRQDVAAVLPTNLRNLAQLPRYIRVEMDVMIGYWLFQDETGRVLARDEVIGKAGAEFNLLLARLNSVLGTDADSFIILNGFRVME
jgi:hypothetical protein